MKTAYLIDRAFLTAHLLTGHIQEAEDATIQAINSWNPDEEPEETVFRNMLEALAHLPIQENPPGPEESGKYLPGELQAVLGLVPALRRCYVLRMLVGLPSQVCARLLRLDAERVDEYTCTALEYLRFQNLTTAEAQSAIS